MSQLRYEWQTNVIYQAHLPERTLSWDEAVAILLDHNLKLKAAREEVVTAEASVKQVFKDLIPTLSLRAGLAKQLTSLDHITADDISLSADSFFSIPGLVNFGSRYYAAKLYLMRAEAAYELTEREQIIELYRLFYSAQELQETMDRLEVQRTTAEAMRQVDPFTGRLMLTELESQTLASRREEEALQDRASALLGSREYQWVFTTNGVPDLHYHENPLPLTDTNRVAQLQMRLLAVELEAAQAVLQGLKLRYWPELNIFITGPPIYQRLSGQERWWDADSLRASADIFWMVDTRGQIRRMIRQTARRQQLQNEQLRLENLALINRLIFTQELIDAVEQQLERVTLQLQLLVQVPPAQDFAAIERYARDYRLLTQEQLRLRQELSELNSLFWFVDDAAWEDELTAAPGPA